MIVRILPLSSAQPRHPYLPRLEFLLPGMMSPNGMFHGNPQRQATMNTAATSQMSLDCFRLIAESDDGRSPLHSAYTWRHKSTTSKDDQMFPSSVEKGMLGPKAMAGVVR